MSSFWRCSRCPSSPCWACRSTWAYWRKSASAPFPAMDHPAIWPTTITRPLFQILVSATLIYCLNVCFLQLPLLLHSRGGGWPWYFNVIIKDETLECWLHRHHQPNGEIRDAMVPIKKDYRCWVEHTQNKKEREKNKKRIKIYRYIGCIACCNPIIVGFWSLIQLPVHILFYFPFFFFSLLYSQLV